MSRASLHVPPRPGYVAALPRGRDAFDAASLAAPAVVFSPHPDDETLGCGGTIVRKRRADAPVTIVHLTDGSRSHDALMPAGELARLRRREALDAASELGVPEASVSFLDFPDGALRRHRSAAQEAVECMLRATRPAQVFVPYRGEAPADHAVANRVVRAALRRCGLAATVFEYPVWFWYHWPRLALPLGAGRATVDLVRNSVRARLGLRVRRDFGCVSVVDDVLDRKRAALGRHRSQMERLRPGWRTLGDVMDGTFLDCFFTGRELFHRYEIPAR